MEGIVFDIDHFAVHDGEGIRTCVYLKGCPMRCLWCHSPESQKRTPEILFASARCAGCGLCASVCPSGAQRYEDGKRTFDREKCTACGRCASACPSGALVLSGRKMTAEEAAREVLADKVFFDSSGGGMTLSGGEVLSQPEFALELLKRVKAHGVHTIVETAGCGDAGKLLEMADYTDWFYYDYKLGSEEEYRRFTGGDLRLTLSNLEKLREKTGQIVLRLPMIPGITDTEENVAALYRLAGRLSVREIHFLPYNHSAGAKYEWCGREYGLGERRADLGQLKRYQRMAPEGIRAKIMA